MTFRKPDSLPQEEPEAADEAPEAFAPDPDYTTVDYSAWERTASSNLRDLSIRRDLAVERLRMQLNRQPRQETAPVAGDSTPLAPDPTAPAERVCPLCCGDGYFVRKHGPGKCELVPCPECTQPQDQVMAGAERHFLLEQMNVYTGLSNLDHMVMPRFRPHAGVAAAYKAAQEFIRQPTGWLLFVGPPKAGKTHLAAAIIRACQAREELAVYTLVPRLLSTIKVMRYGYRSPQVQEYFTYMEMARFSQVLALDAIDFASPNSLQTWIGEKIYQVFNFRYNHALPTIVTCQDLDLLEGRIQSRALDCDLTQPFLLMPPLHRSTQRPSRAKTLAKVRDLWPDDNGE